MVRRNTTVRSLSSTDNTSVSDGRFLVCESMDGEMHSFPHPDVTLNGRSDIVVFPNNPVVISNVWLEEPGFQRALQRGIIKTYRTNEAPGPKLVEAPSELALDDPVLENSALQVLNAPWGEVSSSLVLVEPRDGNRGAINKKYLKTTQLRFLENVLYREERMSCREEVISTIKARIQEIKDM